MLQREKRQQNDRKKTRQRFQVSRTIAATLQVLRSNDRGDYSPHTTM
jgi:hypothetical protein